LRCYYPILEFEIAENAVIENAPFWVVESIVDFVVFEVAEAVLVAILVVSTFSGWIVVPREVDMAARTAGCSCIELDKVDSRCSN
jgi:hypothetical protein